MTVRLAREEDTPGFIALAAQVEHWFGPMADEPGFRSVLARKIRQGTALAVASGDETGLLGGLLFTTRPPAYHVRWLVVSGQARGNRIEYGLGAIEIGMVAHLCLRCRGVRAALSREARSHSGHNRTAPGIRGINLAPRLGSPGTRVRDSGGG
jgi:hypothetical protein